jgi:alpha-glucan phosphorylase-like protein
MNHPPDRALPRAEAPRPSGEADALLRDLHDLTHDLWWTGRPEAHALWPALDPVLWESLQHNPLAMLREVGLTGATPAWRAAAADLVAAWRAALARPIRADLPRVAYLCMEYGLHESLPIYSGGLGMLAGDHLRSAADHGLPLVAVGVFWREGYFRQVLHDGRQAAAYCVNDPARLPLRRVRGADERPLKIEVPHGEGVLTLGAWEVPVGPVRLFLLDADIEPNTPAQRAVTARLYGGDPATRLMQEVALGLGAPRLLRALQLAPELYHMNEGHAAFVTLDGLAAGLEAGLSEAAAWAAVPAKHVFTTHTPVPAGHDRFGWDLIDPALGAWRAGLGLKPGAFMDRGRERPGDVDEPLCMTVLGMNGSRAINAVSALHGEVTREMWRKLPHKVQHITNGVHAGAWLAPETAALWDRWLPGWRDHLDGDLAFWSGAEQIPAEELLRARDARRARLVAEVRRRLGREVLDPKALTIGFARRFAPYKRGDLILRDPERLRALLDRGMQLVFAGKAHPADQPGQQILARILAVARGRSVRDQIVFLPDYDMATGRLLTSCCDVWLNTPQRPREASGTSGQKAALNGNLNLSILDGWWPEAHDGTNGWAIGEERSWDDTAAQDAADAESLYDQLCDEVIPAFADGARWARMSARAMATCAPRFNTHRMVADYARDLYAPAPAEAPAR